MKSEQATRIALGGVFSALCLLIMFLSSIVPFSSFAMPMLAGAMLTVVVIENGEKTAWLVFVTVAVLSLFIVPDLDSKLLFISFFGYYSILKPRIEKISSKYWQRVLKFLIFNIAMIIGYYITLHFFGLAAAAESSDVLGKYSPAIMLLGVNFTFWMYDYLLSRYIALYICWFKPRFLRR